MSDQQRLWEMIGRYVDDAVSSHEVQELEMALRADAHLRKDFISYLNLDASLLEATSALRSEPRSIPFAPVWIGRASAAVVVATAVMLLGGVVWFGLAKTSSVRPMARLLATTNARWSDPNVELALNGGEPIDGPLRLELGRAEFQTMDGATIVLDGPASVRFLNRKVVAVDEGWVFCNCPTPESRLSVITPQTKVVDLGTKFSVDVRAGESTRVTVLSGKVDVNSPQACVLNAGEAVDVRRDVVLRLKPLSPEEIQTLMSQRFSTLIHPDELGLNRLIDAGFERPLPSALWRGTDDALEHVAAAGRTGNAVRIHARGKHFPLVKQRVKTGDITGKIVFASAWAKSSTDDPMTDRQFAVLKIAFLDSAGREFACSTRHFLHSGEPRGAYVPAELAAQAPLGSCMVEVQLMLSASRKPTGSVYFDDAELVIAADVQP